jgi:hypothetical protein
MDKELLHVMTVALLHDDHEAAVQAFHDAIVQQTQHLTYDGKTPAQVTESVINPKAETQRKEMMSRGRSFEQQAKQVWATADIEEKKALLHEMIAGFKFKGKANQFRMKVDAATDPKVLDKLAADLHLAQQGMAVGR